MPSISIGFWVARTKKGNVILDDHVGADDVMGTEAAAGP
jgi:hypothetical protein